MGHEASEQSGLPDWLTSGNPYLPKLSRHSRGVMRARTHAEFEMVFARVIEEMASGSTVTKALRELPIEIDRGAFMGWLKKSPEHKHLYDEAKEIRTETWAGNVLAHAMGEDEDGNTTLEDIARSRLIVDTYKWLMGVDNRRVYGDIKTLEVSGSVSITAALEKARARAFVSPVDDYLDVEVLPAILGRSGESSDSEEEEE